MARVVILGCAGSGKTTLARQMGERLDAPVICLDAIWQPRWTEQDVPRFRALVETLHATEAWVSDGNFADATFDIRLPRATVVVWLERPKLFCAWRVFTRLFRRGETHRFRDLVKVLRFIQRFDQVNRPKIERNRLSFGPDVPVHTLRNKADIVTYLESCAGASVPGTLH